MSRDLWVVGVGPMGRAYTSALKYLGENFTVVGRSDISARAFEREEGMNVVRGGASQALRRLPPPEMAILAVQVSFSVDAALDLMEHGVRRLLLEKPAALTVSDIETLEIVAKRTGAEVWIAYNRRFYSSVKQARKLIEKDGGLTSTYFDFTEFEQIVKALDLADATKQHWLVSNSSHVIDLAFFLSGAPSQIHCLHAGTLDWHPTSGRFCGSGVTERGVLFSYLSDWSSTGRWSVELRTSERKLLLQPLEQLKEMRRGSFDYLPVEIDDRLDNAVKPGLIAMIRAFIDGKNEDLCSLAEQSKAMRLYNQIAGYSDANPNHHTRPAQNPA